MKQILISIKPQWVAKILNGEKTLEIRKTAPKEWVGLHNGKIKKNPEPVTVFIYCTKGKDVLYTNTLNDNFYLNLHEDSLAPGVEKRNGKVVAKFTLKNVYTICNYPALCKTCIMSMKYIAEDNAYRIGSDSVDDHSNLKNMCLSHLELDDYIKGKMGYAWKIDDLEVFDKPKELSEFSVTKKYKSCDKCPHHGYDESFEHCVICEEQVPLKRAPQSWCYVEAEK